MSTESTEATPPTAEPAWPSDRLEPVESQGAPEAASGGARSEDGALFEDDARLERVGEAIGEARRAAEEAATSTAVTADERTEAADAAGPRPEPADAAGAGSEPAEGTEITPG